MLLILGLLWVFTSHHATASSFSYSLTFKTLMCKYLIFYIHNNMDHGNWHLWDDRSINLSWDFLKKYYKHLRICMYEYVREFVTYQFN